MTIAEQIRADSRWPSIQKFLEVCHPEDRDSIMRHGDPTYDGREWWDGKRGCGCLVGTAVGEDYDGQPMRAWHHKDPRFLAGFMDMTASVNTEVGYAFPKLCADYGSEPVWRECKLECARLNGSTESEIHLMLAFHEERATA